MKYQKTRIVNKSIPDNSPKGFKDEIWINRNVTINSISVDVELSHSYKADLAIEFSGPNGKLQTLKGPGKLDNSKVARFSGGPLAQYAGDKSKGKYTLKVIDTSAGDTGYVKSWSVNLDLKNSKKSETSTSNSDQFSSAVTCQTSFAPESVKLNVAMQASDKVNLRLTAPNGEMKKFVFDPAKGGKQVFESEISGLKKSDSQGEWTLTSSDNAKGRLLNWKLSFKGSQKQSSVDDLTKIEGIGPKIQQLLQQDGVMSFSDLATSKPERIKAILDKAGPRYQMHDPGSWPRQAGLAAAGKWDELQKLQDELDGGR